MVNFLDGESHFPNTVTVPSCNIMSVLFGTVSHYSNIVQVAPRLDLWHNESISIKNLWKRI